MTRKFRQIKLINSLFNKGRELIKFMMRTFIFLLCTTLFGLTPKHAMSQNEKIVIKIDKVMSVDAVFKMIKAQTDYSFVYHEKLFKDFPKVKLKKGTIRLNKLLDQSLSAGDINVIFTANNTILIKETNKAGVQQRSVSGTVTDQAGLPVPGATVLIKGTTKGTTTNLDGHYTITVPDPANVLVFSGLGFKTREITVGNHLPAGQAGTTINIKLKEDINELAAVELNWGYGKTSQRKATGSISKIDARTIEKQPVNNPLAAMQGHLPGVNITQNSGLSGGGYRIQIRGENFIEEGGNILGGSFVSTINSPLYVVDGVPFSSESLEWGNMAAKILPSGQVSPLNTINPADIKSIEVLKDADATAIYGSRGANGVVLITTKKGKEGKMQVKVNMSTSLSEVTGFVELLNTQQYLDVRREAHANEGIAIPTTARDLLEWDQERYTDWQELFIGRTAYRQNAQLSLTGGSEQTQFLLSGGYTSESTIFPGDSRYESASLRFNLRQQSRDNRFKLNFSASYAANSNNLPGSDISTQAWLLPPNAPALYDDQGNINSWGDFDSGINSTFVNNPATFLEKEYQAQSHNLTANAVLSYQLVPSLEFSTSLGYTQYGLESYLAEPHTSFASDNFIDSSDSFINRNIGARKSWIVEPQINWQHHWVDDDISLKVLIGTTFQQNKSGQLHLFAEGFTSNSLLYSLSAGSIQNIIQDTISEYKYQAFFGRINLNLKDTYILNLTGRRDGSSRFGSGKQYGFFGAAGMAWLFSEEAFLAGNSVISFGKLRASYGITGSDNVGDYQFYDAYNGSGNYNGVGLAPTALFNPNYSWGEAKKLEAALELGFLRDRIFLTAAWYRNRSSNQLINIPLPTTTGFSGINKNFDATVQNTGLEIDLKSTNIESETFKWHTTFNVSANRSKLVAFPGLEGSTYASRLVVGQPFGIQKRFHYLGIDPETGIYQFEDYNNDGHINDADNNVLEDFTPKFYGGLGNTITYKNLQLDVFFQFSKQKGNKFLGGGLAGGSGIGNIPTKFLDRWRQPRDQTTYQRYYAENNRVLSEAASDYENSDANVTDRSFIRLRNVSLNYTVPKIVTKGMDLNIYLQGQNLFVITRYDGADPESNTTGTAPPLRQITLGLNVSF